MYSLRLLGGVLLEGPSGPASGRAAQRRQLALLALLACARDKGLTRDKLVGYLWPETDGERARRHLSDALYVLRRSLGEDAVVAAGEALRLDPSGVRCDVCEFEDALEREDLEAAVALYGGPLLDGFYLGDGRAFEGWVEAERAQLADRYAGAVETLAERAEEAGAYRDAAERWKRLAAHDPYNSRAMVRLVEALAAAGDPANALELARVHEVRLREEMGIEPPADLAAAIERLKQEPAPGQSHAARGEQSARVPIESPVVVAKDESAATPEPWTFHRLISEIHRRTLWQVLLVYAGASWAVFAAVQTLTEGLGLPGWFPAFALVLLLAGLPFVLATAFVQEGPPLVSRRARRRPAEESVVKKGEAAEGIRRFFSWRNAILAGVVAFALLGVGTAAYMAMRAMGIGPVGSLVAKGVIDQEKRIILSDFETNTGDSLLALAVTEAFRIDLLQSPLVRLVDRDQIARVLARMNRDAAVPLDYDLAREVAIREGIEAVITGEINTVGAGYVLSARLTNAQTGEALAGQRVTAGDSTGIIPAVDRLSKALRGRIGESLKSIRANPPLEQVTTSSLQALRKYSQANNLSGGQIDRMLALHEEAVSLDTTFAMAWSSIGNILYTNSLEPSRQIEAMKKAYALRDRLTEGERYDLIGTYHIIVTADYARAEVAYRMLADLYPHDWRALNGLAWLYQVHLREYGRAVELAQRAAQEDSFYIQPYGNAAIAQANLGKFEEAEATLKRAMEKLPDNMWGYTFYAGVAYAKGDFDAAEYRVLELRERAGPGNQMWRYRTSNQLARLSMIRGRLGAAEGHYLDAIAVSEKSGVASIYLANTRPFIELFLFRGEADAGLEKLEAALERYPLAKMAPLDRPYLELANIYARAGRVDQAKALLADFEANVDPIVQRRYKPWHHRSLGHVALAEGRFREAIAEFRRQDESSGCPLCALPHLGEAHDLAGEPDSAIALYERYIATPSFHRGWFDPYYLARFYERLGELHEARGDSEKSIYYYGKFVDLWKDADPGLQPRVDAARRAIAALSPEI